MDQLRRHWEKILLTVSLVVLLAAAVMLLLKIGALSEEVKGFGATLGSGKKLAELDPAAYQVAIQRLQEPVQWTNMTVDPFQPSMLEKIETPEPSTNRRIETVAAEFTITLLQVQQEPFKMIFLAYIGTGRDFQLNMQFRPRTFFIKKVDDSIQDQFWKTGYVVTKFEPKFAKMHDPKLGVDRNMDVSELTVQHPGEDPVVLVLGQPAVAGEPVALVACERRGYNPAMTQVRRGQLFRCGMTTYNVVDIKADRMLINDPQKPEEKPKEIKLRSATPVTEEEGAAGWPPEVENLNQ